MKNKNLYMNLTKFELGLWLFSAITVSGSFLLSPIAVLTVISWIKHPYGKTSEVTVNRMTKLQVAVMYGLTIIVTVVFYYILKALGTANLFLSTVSIAPSFLASYLTLMRSSYYAVGYMANNIVSYPVSGHKPKHDHRLILL